MKNNGSPTNRTTTAILSFLFESGVYAYRQNSTGIPDVRKGIFRPAAKVGLPDIVGILPDTGDYYGCKGTYLGVEVKTGKDTLRPEQLGTHENIKRMGGIVLVVKDYEDFINQWNKLWKKPN